MLGFKPQTLLASSGYPRLKITKKILKSAKLEYGNHKKLLRYLENLNVNNIAKQVRIEVFTLIDFK